MWDIQLAEASHRRFNRFLPVVFARHIEPYEETLAATGVDLSLHPLAFIF
jgi:hypothetical protein